jgi:hypothetical protein
MAKPCFKLDIATTKYFYTDATSAERPLNFQPKLTIGDESIPVVDLPPEMLWARIELMRNMATGHEVDSLAHFFATLTVHDYSALALAINGAAALGQRTAQLSANVPNASQGASLSLRDADEGVHSQYWAMETGTASFRTTFDPMSRRRRAIIANPRQACFYGMHPEEFQARCASRDLPFPITDEDAVALFIYASIGEHFRSETSAELFIRLYMGGRGCGTAVLISARRWVALDASGSISEVRPVLRN